MFKCESFDSVILSISSVLRSDLQSMERNQDSRATMAEGLGVECSSLPLGGNDDLNGLFRRQEQLNREIKYSLQELCGQLRSDSVT